MPALNAQFIGISFMANAMLLFSIFAPPTIDLLVAMVFI
jgi:hypothetical protein